MAGYGIPGEVLTDNGKQFTGRFGKPRPPEVLFERIRRENGITQRQRPAAAASGRRVTSGSSKTAARPSTASSAT